MPLIGTEPERHLSESFQASLDAYVELVLSNLVTNLEPESAPEVSASVKHAEKWGEDWAHCNMVRRHGFHEFQSWVVSWIYWNVETGVGTYKDKLELETLASLFQPSPSTEKASMMAIWPDRKAYDAGDKKRLRGKPGRMILKVFPFLNNNQVITIVDEYLKRWGIDPDNYVVKTGQAPADFKHAYSHERSADANLFTTSYRKSLSCSCMRYGFDHLPHHPAEALGPPLLSSLAATLTPNARKTKVKVVVVQTGSTPAQCIAASKLLATQLTEATSKTFDKSEAPYRQQDIAYATIREMGLNEISGGSGCYVLGVVEHPDLPGRVYKICHGDPRVDPYIEYAQWIMDNPEVNENPHFPRIFDISYSADGNIATVTMEKLSPLFEAPEETLDFLEDDYRAIYHNVSVRATPSRKMYLPKPSAGYTNASLKRACEMLFNRFDPDGRVRFDLHRNNVMLRGNTCMVILDPIAPAA